MNKLVWAATFVLGSFLLASAPYEPLDMFLCQGKWDGQGEVTWFFKCGEEVMTVRLHPNRCQFLLNGEPLGWSELMPPQLMSPTVVSLYRNKFRWSLLLGRALVATAFADLNQMTSWVGASIETVQSAPTVLERSFIPFRVPRPPSRVPPENWRGIELDDGSIAFAPPDQTGQVVFPLNLEGTNLTDIFVTLEVQPNGARSVGIGVCWGDDGGYLWRWVRRRGEGVWQLAVAQPCDSGWELTTIHEEPAFIPATSWQQLQVWRSGNQLWVGVDGEVLAQVQDNRFSWGQVVVWVESGDLPQPLVKPIKLKRWWCATLCPDIDTHVPFPAVFGKWQAKSDSWVLKTDKEKQFALALLGTPDLPSWWIADVLWQNEPVGLVFGWLGEKHYHLLRLRPLKKLTPSSVPHSVIEIVAVREGREKVLDEWTVLLERNKVYRLAVQLTANRAVGFINGLNLVAAEVSPIGKVGLWANSSLTLHRFWFYTGEEQLVSLNLTEGGIVHPVSEQPFVAHEMVSLTLPAGLPPGVPLSARLSQEPITLFAERQGHRLLIRLERGGKPLGFTSFRLPSQPPITIKMERRDRVLLVWLENQPVLTIRLP